MQSEPVRPAGGAGEMEQQVLARIHDALGGEAQCWTSVISIALGLGLGYGEAVELFERLVQRGQLERAGNPRILSDLRVRIAPARRAWGR